MLFLYKNDLNQYIKYGGLMKVNITLLGNFELSYYDEEKQNLVSFSLSGLGKELQDLIQLLIVNRTAVMSRNDLMDSLYSNRKDPAGCLKYAIFRLRDALKVCNNLELIVTKSSGYTLNPDYIYTIDTELLNKYSSNYKMSEKESERELLCDKIMGIYKGYFYQSPSAVMWSINSREFYHNLFTKVVVEQGEAFYAKKEYSKAIDILSRANTIDQLNEDINYILLKALVEDKRYVRALDFYKAYSRLYMDSYGEPVPKKIRKYFYVITSDTLYDKLTPDNIHEILIKEESQIGAFFCNYDIFTHIYQIESRKIKRFEKTSSVNLLLIIDLANEVNEQATRFFMDQLQKAIHKSLRKGDVFTQANRKQFLVLCVCHKLDDSKIIFDRISSTFYKSPICIQAKIQYSISELIPYDS